MSGEGVNLTSVAVFVAFVSLSLFITWWAAKRTHSTDEFYTAGAKITGVQNGLALAGELATETGGNPFFVAEMLRSLIESGAITFDETARRWNVDLTAVPSLPESVLEVIEHRVDRLLQLLAGEPELKAAIEKEAWKRRVEEPEAFETIGFQVQ